MNTGKDDDENDDDNNNVDQVVEEDQTIMRLKRREKRVPGVISERTMVMSSNITVFGLPLPTTALREIDRGNDGRLIESEPD